MKALTLWPEWLIAFTHMGKRVENRGWAPPADLIGQRIAMHAGVSIGGGRRDGFDGFAETAYDHGWRAAFLSKQDRRLGRMWIEAHCHPATGGPKPGEMVQIPRGAIVLTAVLQEVRRHSHIMSDQWGRWAIPGAVHWCLGEPDILPAPIPCRGAQGLWNVPEDLREQHPGVFG